MDKREPLEDSNPRPLKRARVESPPPSSPLSAPPQSPPAQIQKEIQKLTPLSPSALLLSLPRLLLLPPTHKHHPHSLHLSLLALRRCLALGPGALTPEAECRAWTGLAEVGMRVVGGGFCEEEGWAKGVEGEVGNAIGKAMLIAQKHPSLRLYKLHLTLLSSHLALQQRNFKYSRALLRRLIASELLPSDPPAFVYGAHLALIGQLAGNASTCSIPTPSPSPNKGGVSVTDIGSPTKRTPKKNDLALALSAISALSSLSAQNRHPQVTLLAHVLRLKLLIDHAEAESSGAWGEEVRDALGMCERGLGVSYASSTSARDTTPTKKNKAPLTPQSKNLNQTPNQPPHTPLKTPSKPTPSKHTHFIAYTSPLESSLALVVLTLGVLYYTHIGSAEEARERLRHLHALCDYDSDSDGQDGGGEERGGALGKLGGGYVQIDFGANKGPPLVVTVPHPRVMLLLTYLVSATSKRDTVGRHPRRKAFATEGVRVCERERTTEVVFGLRPFLNSLSPGLESGPGLGPGAEATVGDLLAVERTAARIEAELLSEVVSVAIMRSEWGEAEDNLNALITHTRTAGLFPAYAPLITLHHAHLAHALGRAARAVECYRVAAFLAEEGGGEGAVAGAFVRVAARAGEVALSVGLARGGGSGGDGMGMLVDGDGAVAETGLDEYTKTMGRQVARECQGMGGTLEAVGQVIEACLSDEILKSKDHLKKALDLATLAQDNHLRALVLAQISSHYFHTEIGEALSMLGTCEQLAAGLGAGSGKKGKDGTPSSVGNAPLRLWVGQKFLGLYKRLGKGPRAQKQARANMHLAEVVEQIAKRASTAV